MTVEYAEDSNGKKLSNNQGIALCRYRVSNNKPFCHGTHSLIGFLTIEKDNKKSITSKRVIPVKK